MSPADSRNRSDPAGVPSTSTDRDTYYGTHSADARNGHFELGPAWQRQMSAASRLVVTQIVAVTLVVALIGFAFDIPFLRGSAVSVFLLAELGIAPCLLMAPMPPMWFALRSLAGGLSATVLLGFGMAISHLWYPVAMFDAVVLITGGILVWVIIRDTKAVPIGWFASWTRPLVTPRRLVNSCVALGVITVAAQALTHRTNPRPGGLMSELGLGWYLGLILVIAGAVWAWRIGVSPAFAVLALAGVVVFSQALTYGAPAVMSSARHVGIIDYIRVNHEVQPSLDIYQAWSGLFAGVAWLCDAGGISDPLIVATWWPVLLSPALALGVAAMASRWIAGNYRVWFAGVVFVLTSTLNIIYFSPQALGVFLAVAIFALVAGPSKATPRPEKNVLRVSNENLYKRFVRACRPLSPGTIGFVLLLACAMAVTHQISPYLTTAGLIILGVLRFMRPWWISLVVLVPAIIWAWANQGVLGGFISLGAVGRLWDNVQPPVHSLAQLPQPLVTRLAFDVPALLLFVTGLLALIHALRTRAKYSWVLLVVAASPATLFLATDYGQEGIFRVVLFAGPWLAILVAGLTWKSIGVRWSIAALTITLVTMLGVNAYGQTALDWNRMIRPDTAAATRLYETTSQYGSVMLLTGTANATPLARTARYLEVSYITREAFGPYPAVNRPYNASADVEQLTKKLVTVYQAPQYYALVSDSIGAYDERYGFQPYSQYVQLADAMARSSSWEPIFKGKTTTMYKLKDPSAVRGR